MFKPNWPSVLAGKVLAATVLVASSLCFAQPGANTILAAQAVASKLGVDKQ